MSVIRVRAKVKDDMSNSELSAVITKSAPVVAISELDKFKATTQDNCVNKINSMLNVAITTLKADKDFLKAVSRTSDSIYTNLGFYNVCINNVIMPLFDEQPKDVVGLQGFVYTENSNIYICVNKDVNIQHRNYTKIMLTAYVLTHFAAVLTNTGVFSALALFCKDSTTKLWSLEDTVDDCSVEYLTNYILSWQHRHLSTDEWSGLYPYYIYDKHYSCEDSGVSDYMFKNMWSYYYIKEENYDMLSNIVRELNSSAHVVYPDSFSTSKIEMGYIPENEDSLDTILDDYDRNRDKVKKTEDTRYKFSESAFKQFQAYRKSDIDYLAAKLALEYDFKDYETFNRYLNMLLTIRRECK